MSTIPVTVTEVKTVEQYCSELSSKVDALVKRMKLALDAIAEENGAWECESCGEWTLEDVVIEGYSEELGYETSVHCRRCI